MKGTVEKQLEIEEQIKEEAIQKYLLDLSNAISQNRFSQTNEGFYLLKATLNKYEEALNTFLDTSYRGQLEKDKKLLFLMFNKTDVLALSVLNEVINSIGSGSSIAVTSLALKIVRELKKVAMHKNITHDNPKFISYLGTEFKRASKSRKDVLIAKHLKDLKDFDVYNKDTKIATRIGAMLLDVLEKSGANIIEKFTIIDGVRTIYHYRLTQEAKEGLLKLGRNALGNIMTNANRLPMIVPPVPFDNDTLKGGYYKYPIPLVKAIHKEHRAFIKGKDYSKVIPVVNKLQAVPWKFNSRVIDVMTDIFENNMLDPRNRSKLPKLFGGLPTASVYKVDELVKKEEFGRLKNGWELGKEAFHSYTKAKNEMYILLDKEMGNRLALMFALSVYTKMCDYDAIYFPQQLDYRGRVYPHPTFVSIQQPSYIKAMLEFADGEVLDAVGMDGLKIHLSNCFGNDKAPFDERIKFIEDNLEDILKTAQDPIEHIFYWTQADSPFEFLAGCFALDDALKGLPVTLPIQLDSTCSGIQMYSGLLLDEEGALAVNVIGDTRQDIYGKVADKVNSYLELGEYPQMIEFKDSEGAERIVSTIIEAESIKGKIKRAHVKKNVMTLPYNASFRGMQDQVRADFEDIKFNGDAFWKGEFWVVVRLLATLNSKGIYEIVKGAVKGQEYFKDCAKALKRPATWLTPIYNLPIMQPAYKTDTHIVQTLIGRLSVQYSTDELDRRSQVNAIAPNIIHSIDSTVLYGTVDKFKETHIGTIHDCFLCHPNYWRDMQEAFKDAYIEIMESNPMEFIGRQLDPEGLIEIPMINTLNLKDVKNSKYIIS